MNDLGRLWSQSVNLSSLAVATATHTGVARRYKLSVPTGDETTNSQVFVYDYEPEVSEGTLGGWTRYTNHPVTGWCNNREDSFWSSSHGDVFKVRRRGDSTDYRDEASPVAESVVELRAEDFGVPALRKIFRNFVTFLDLSLTNLTGLRVFTKTNAKGDYEEVDQVSRTSTSDRFFRSSLGARRGNFVQVKYTHQHLDERMTVSGISYTVAQQSYKLTGEAKDG